MIKSLQNVLPAERKVTHSFFSLPLVRLDLQLEFIHQLLQTHQVLLVLLRLKINRLQLIEGV